MYAAFASPSLSIHHHTNSQRRCSNTLPVPQMFTKFSVSRLKPTTLHPFHTKQTNLTKKTLQCTAKTPTSDDSQPKKPKVGAIGIVLILAALIWSIVIFSVMLVIHPFVLLFDPTRRRLHQSLVFLWMRDTFRTAFLRVLVTGRENLPTKPCLFISNHESILDMFAFSFIKSPARFMIPTKAFKLPLVGWMMKFASWIGVDGVDRRSQMNALQNTTNSLKEGSSVIVFPQGNPSTKGPVAKFPSPIFKIARKANVPVVPLSVHGTGEMFEDNVAPQKWPNKHISITVHKPVIMDDRSDKEIAEVVHQAVTSVLPA